MFSADSEVADRDSEKSNGSEKDGDNVAAAKKSGNDKKSMEDVDGQQKKEPLKKSKRKEEKKSMRVRAAAALRNAETAVISFFQRAAASARRLWREKVLGEKKELDASKQISESNATASKSIPDDHATLSQRDATEATKEKQNKNDAEEETTSSPANRSFFAGNKQGKRKSLTVRPNNIELERRNYQEELTKKDFLYFSNYHPLFMSMLLHGTNSCYDFPY